MEECLFIVDVTVHSSLHWYATAIDCIKDVAEQTGIYIYVNNDCRRSKWYLNSKRVLDLTYW